VPSRWAAKFETAVKAWGKKDWQPLPYCVACGHGFEYMPAGLQHMPMGLVVIEGIEA